MHFLSKFTSTILLAASLAACSYIPNAITPYRIDIQQGNYITQDMVSQLKPGMSKDQVRFILGTPLIVDPFRPDRWDYIYSMQHGFKKPEMRRLLVHFVDGKLNRLEGDVVPAPEKPAAEKPAMPAVPTVDASKPVPEEKK